MAPAVAAVVRKQRRRGPAVPSMPRPASRAHVARHPRDARLSFQDHGRELMRVVVRVVPGLVFLDADDLVAVLGVVLDLVLGREPAHLRVVVWRDGDLLVVLLLLLLLLDMGGPAGIFDLELVVGMLFVHLGQLGAVTRAWVDQVPFVRVA